ncbi:MAG TPA: hypothetical protein VNM37_15495, partial [Candidatus Dormibacteraeota bacterium]|nr:hypothetical protein [Candidatus Dormibacteraeota bacterium]
MKRMICLLGFVSFVMLFPVFAHAQSYNIDWFTVDGGGGVSSGGTFSLSGTIGQPDAGRATGGSFALEGGFWSGVQLIPTFGAPQLQIEHAGAGVRVFWPVSGAAGYLLDRSDSLPGGWGQVSSGYQTNGSQISITIPVPIGMQFYRL